MTMPSLELQAKIDLDFYEWVCKAELYEQEEKERREQLFCFI